MNIITKGLKYFFLAFLLLIILGNVWGYLTLGTLTPELGAVRDKTANQVVMVFGATGSVGDGLLKAAMEDEEVNEIHVVTRRSSPRIEEGAASGRLIVHMHDDFENYDDLRDHLARTNTVLWALGSTSIGMDDETYTWIHVDFPVAFVNEWLSARRHGPMSFHYIAGMGTDGSAHWALEKSRAERELAELAADSDLRTFSYRSGFIRPSTETANAFHYILETLLRPGRLVITSRGLGGAMLEISARTSELKNGTLIDNADSIAYAEAYRSSQ